MHSNLIGEMFNGGVVEVENNFYDCENINYINSIEKLKLLM